MQQLGALDALFLYLETPETPMHVGSLILFQKPKGHRGSFYPNIRRHIESRMHLAPLFTRKLAFMPFDLANPVWLNDHDIDLDWHIRKLTLPKPGTMAQLEAAVAKLHEGMLDRDRPLWQFTIIEGLQSGEVAFTSRIHHAGLDGQGGVALAQAVLDVEANPKPRAATESEKSRSSMPPSAAKMLSAAFRNSVAQYGKIIKAGAGAVKMAGGMATAAGMSMLTSSEAKKMGAPSEQLSGMGNLSEMAEFAGNLTKVKTTDTPLQAAKKMLPKGMKLGPRTPLNVAITAPRAFMTARIPLAEAKAIAKHFDVKINEVILATVAGALRRYYAKDKAIVAKAMIGAVPASLRTPGDTTQNNQVTMMLVNMATNTADPAKRIAAIREASTAAKVLTSSMKGATSTLVSDLPTLGIPWLMSVITPLYKSAVSTNRIPVVANVVISNVPGPPMPLYMAGAAMTSYFPVSIVTHGLALNITIHSYAGSLDYGLIAAKDQVPKLGDFVKHLYAAHQELMALVAVPDATPEKVKKAANKVAKKVTAPVAKKPVVKKVAKKVAKLNTVKRRGK
jgi:diacylglycerol O-acyltransferase / wax synthase